MGFSVTDNMEVSRIAGMCGFTGSTPQPVLKNGNVSWYYMREDRDLGDEGDLYYKILFIALRDGELLAYANGVEIWGSSIAYPALEETYPWRRNSSAFQSFCERMAVARKLLCPDDSALEDVAADESEAEEDSSNHVLMVMEDLALPSEPYDAFDQAKSYTEFLDAVRAATIALKGRLIFVTPDPFVEYALSNCDTASDNPLPSYSGMRCELL